MASLSGQTVVTNALVTIGIYGQGEIPSVSDSNDALVELNDMWEAWGIDEGLIFAVQQQTFAWGSVASNPVGPGATAPFNIALPTKIYTAFWKASGGGARVPLAVVNSQIYYAHRDLTATSALSPDELYADFLVGPGTGNSNFYLWPVPSATGTLEIESGAPFAMWNLNSTYNLPLGYVDAINYVLAARLIPRYGVSVQPQIAQTVLSMAEKAEDRLRQMNLINRQMPKGTEQATDREEAEVAQTAGR